MAAGTGPARREDGSSDFDKKFAGRAKILSANFCADTLALVTEQENQTHCEQLVSNAARRFSPCLAKRPGVLLSGLIHRVFRPSACLSGGRCAPTALTEGIYATICFPTPDRQGVILPAVAL